MLLGFTMQAIMAEAATPDSVFVVKNGLIVSAYQVGKEAGLEHKRPQKGDGSGDGTVVQGGEEAGGEDVEACQ